MSFSRDFDFDFWGGGRSTMLRIRIGFATRKLFRRQANVGLFYLPRAYLIPEASALACRTFLSRRPNFTTTTSSIAIDLSNFWLIGTSDCDGAGKAFPASLTTRLTTVD